MFWFDLAAVRATARAAANGDGWNEDTSGRRPFRTTPARGRSSGAPKNACVFRGRPNLVEPAKRAVAEGHGTLFAPIIEAEIKIYGGVFYVVKLIFALAKSVTSERAGEIPRRPRSGPTSVHALVI